MCGRQCAGDSVRETVCGSQCERGSVRETVYGRQCAGGVWEAVCGRQIINENLPSKVVAGASGSLQTNGHRRLSCDGASHANQRSITCKPTEHHM